MQFLGQSTDSTWIETVYLFRLFHGGVEEGVGDHLSDVTLTRVIVLSWDETLRDVLLTDEFLKALKFILQFFVVIHSWRVLSVLRMRFLSILIPNTERRAPSGWSVPRIYIHGRVNTSTTVKALSSGINMIKHTLSPMWIICCGYIMCRIWSLTSIDLVRNNLG